MYTLTLNLSISFFSFSIRVLSSFPIRVNSCQKRKGKYLDGYTDVQYLVLSIVLREIVCNHKWSSFWHFHTNFFTCFNLYFNLEHCKLKKIKDQNVTIPLLLAQVKVLLQRLLKVQLTLKIDFKKDSAMSI